MGKTGLTGLTRLSGKHRRIAGATGLSALLVIAFGLVLASGPAFGAVTSDSNTSQQPQSQAGAMLGTSAPTATTGTSSSSKTSTSSKSSTTQQAPQVPQVTTPAPSATDTPSVPTATATATATSTPTNTPTPAPTATPAPTWHTLGTWSGSSLETLATFNGLSGKVRIRWTCDAAMGTSWHMMFLLADNANSNNMADVGFTCVYHTIPEEYTFDPLTLSNYTFSTVQQPYMSAGPVGSWTATLDLWY